MRVRLRSERRIVGRDLKEERIVDAAVHRKDGDKIAFAEREELLSRQKEGDDGIRRVDALGNGRQKHDVCVLFARDGDEFLQKIKAHRPFEGVEIGRKIDAEHLPRDGGAHILRKGVGAVAEHIDDLPHLLFCLFADLLILSVVEDVRDGRFAHARRLGDILDRNFFVHSSHYNRNFVFCQYRGANVCKNRQCIINRRRSTPMPSPKTAWRCG